MDQPPAVVTFARLRAMMRGSVEGPPIDVREQVSFTEAGWRAIWGSLVHAERDADVQCQVEALADGALLVTLHVTHQGRPMAETAVRVLPGEWHWRRPVS